MTKKLTSRDLKKLIIETINKENSKDQRKNHLRSVIKKANAILEDADPAKVDSKRFPLKLSAAGKVGAEVAAVLTTGGDDDGEIEDDIVNASPDSKPVKMLKPSQSSMNIHKALCFAIAAVMKMPPFASGPGGDLGAIITSDNHIMDGHHRWIASGMVDPNVDVGGFVVEFPAKQMIAALNMVTVHLTGRQKGKPGSGGFDQFNEAGILEVLTDFAANGASIPGKGPWKGLGADVVKQACETFTGTTGVDAVTAAAKKFAENADELTLSVPDGFPSRPDMPVISKGEGHLDKAIELLKSGQVDLNEPYAYETVIEDGITKKTNNVLLERWNKLAGMQK